MVKGIKHVSLIFSKQISLNKLLICFYNHIILEAVFHCQENFSGWERRVTKNRSTGISWRGINSFLNTKMGEEKFVFCCTKGKISLKAPTNIFLHKLHSDKTTMYIPAIKQLRQWTISIKSERTQSQITVTTACCPTHISFTASTSFKHMLNLGENVW